MSARDKCLQVDLGATTKDGASFFVSSPFSSLSIWRSKMQQDLSELPQSQDFKLKLLLEQSKDCEQGVYGCLIDALHELSEAENWDLISADLSATERERLYGQASQELNNDKHFILELARDSEQLEEFCRELLQPINHTVADYETLGQLRFATMCWKANLNILLSVSNKGSNQAELELKEGYEIGMRLVRRCVTTSTKFWSSQSGSELSSHTKSSQELVLRAAEDKIKRGLEEIAESHHISQEVVQSIINAVSLEDLDVSGKDASAVEKDKLTSPGEDRYELFT